MGAGALFFQEAWGLEAEILLILHFSHGESNRVAGSGSGR